MVVDDVPIAVELYASILQDAGYDVMHARNAGEAVKCAAYLRDIHLLIADYDLPDKTGSELAHWFRHHREYTPILILSATPEFLRMAAAEAPFAARMDKTAPVDEFVAMVDMLMGASGAPPPD